MVLISTTVYIHEVLNKHLRNICKIEINILGRVVICCYSDTEGKVAEGHREVK